MKNPVLIILTGSAGATLILSFLQFFLQEWQHPDFWIFAITLLASGIIVLAISLLLATRRLNPHMGWLPPPFKY